MKVDVNGWCRIERTQNGTEHGSGQDGHQAEGWWQTGRGVEVLCKRKKARLTLAAWAALAEEAMSGEARAVTLQKQGRRRSQAALHARLVLLTAHQESGMNEWTI